MVSVIKDGKEENVEDVAGENIKVTPGTIVKYRIKVTNGKIALKDVKIVDEMANKKDIYTTYNAETKKLSNKVTNGVVRTIENLAANAVVDEENPIYVYYEVDETDTENTKLNPTIDNTASVTGKYEDNSGKTVELPPVEDDAFVTVKEDTKLKVEKHQYIENKKLKDNEEDVKVKPGTVITYEILVTNLGNVDQKDIAISDVMKLNDKTRDDLKVEDDMTIDSKHELKNGKITLLGIGDTATITAKYEVQEKDMATTSQTIKNTATARNESDDVTIKTEEYTSKVTVTKNGTVKDGETGKTTEITNSEEAMKVKYGDEITYKIVISNEGLKPGSVKVWDTILKDMKDDVELVGSIKLVDSKGTTLKTLNEQDRALLETETSTGYQITGVEDGNDVSLVFTIRIKAYAGTLLSNIAKYKTDGDKTPTNPVTVDVEDTAYVVSTSTTKVPQKAILVLDFSSSMNDAANGRPVSYWNPSKLSTLKSAVNSFLTEYFKANEDNEVMIITYGNSATRVCNYTKSADDAYLTIEDATIPDNGEGTNMVAGLRLAYANISEADAKNTSVILMTDGIPGYKYNERTGQYEIVRDSNGNSGVTYVKAAGDSTKKAAKLITDTDAKLFTIGFGLSNRQAKQMLKDCATPDTDTVKYYHEVSDDDALITAFNAIANSVTTNSEPVDKDTEEGVLVIEEGFKEGQNVEIYIDYDTENPPESKDAWKTYTWDQFKNLNNGKTGNDKINYTTIKTVNGKQVLEFKFGQFLKDNEDKSKGIGPDTVLTFRFVNPKTN